MSENNQKPRPVAVVTGGGSGIGKAICERLASDGHPVAVCDVNGEAAATVAKEIEAAGGVATAYAVDVSDRNQVEEAFAAVGSDLGKIGILVTSAAIAPRAPFMEITTEEWERTMGINLTGTFHCIQTALRDMLEVGWGRVVLISSSSAQRGAVEMVHYGASKGGIIALTKSLGLELARTGVTVNNIAPSAVHTPSVQRKVDSGALGTVEQLAETIPVGRLGTGADIAWACTYLVSPEASYVTGQTISVNGGAFVG